MITAISTALSGLKANSDAINVIGNDLANLNTTGYKADQIEFQDMMSESLGVSGNAGQLGNGVGQVSSIANYSQGAIQTTNGATDAAIQGNGFFVLSDPRTNGTLYTRDGNFQVNSGGQLTTTSGQLVQGWTEVNGVINSNAPAGNLTLPVGATVAATPTSAMTLALNLDSSVATTATGAVVTAPIQVFDSQGTSHNLTATFTKTAQNTWDYSVSIPAADLASGSTTPLTTGTLTFDNNGNLTGPPATTDPQVIPITGLSDGSADMSINWNLYDHSGASPTPEITQYASPSSISSTSQNGYAAGSVAGVALQTGGIVLATYTNGQKVAIGQVALASIANPASLASVGNNNLQVTPDTSTPLVGAAGTGGRGQIVAGALESSTVDIATEFANLLTFERGYQANSRIITTSDQLEQQTVNLIPAA
ncbi:MAG TPA: flagellar hook protein FlgE [Bryobacteraceae bacterium]|jgi:flagellar hook protein FlgE|nr:flagellar hook protein FlgE [Bryobacteraceae bacterium]